MEKDYTITIECRDKEMLSKGEEASTTYECDGYTLFAEKGRGMYIDARGEISPSILLKCIFRLNKQMEGALLEELSNIMVNRIVGDGADAPTDQEEATDHVQH